MKSSTEVRIGRVRGRVPRALLPAVVGARTRLAWRSEAVRDDARAQMRFLLERTRPGADLEQAARDYVRFQALRGELRWHLDAITDVDVVGLDHLQSAREGGRGVVVSFMHHAFFEGAFAAIGRHGVPLQLVCYPYMLRDDAPGWLQQHVRVATSTGAVPFPSDRGGRAMAEALVGGAVLGIATDVPGHTPLRFCGHDVLGSFGAARLAMSTGSPVVLLTSERQQGDRPLARLHEPFDPHAFPDPHKLLEAMVAVHEEAQLRWPEAVDIPLSRWGDPDAGDDS